MENHAWDSDHLDFSPDFASLPQTLIVVTLRFIGGILALVCYFSLEPKDLLWEVAQCQRKIIG